MQQTFNWRRALRPEKGFYKTAFALMLPIIVQNLISHMLGLSDTLMVGVIGETELAAMTVANTPFFVLTIMMFGIQSGACVLVAQYHGKRDLDAINRILGAGFYAGIICTLLAAIVIGLFPEQMMDLLTSNKQLVPIGARYARIIGISYVFASISGIYIAVQRSMEKAALGAWILGGSSLLNIFLNWVLIFGKLGAPKLGIEGAAIATVIARICEVIAVAIYAARDKNFPVRPGLILNPGRAMLRDFVRYGVPVMLNETFWSLGTSLFTVIMGYMQNSTAILAASTLTSNVERVISVIMFAAGNAAAVLIGKSIGEGGRERAYDRAMTLNVMGLGIGLVNTALLLVTRFTLAPQVLYPMMDLSMDARAIANFMLVMLAVVAPFRALNTINIVGVLRGGGDVKTGMYLDVLPMFLFALPGSAIAALVLQSGIVWMYLLKISDDVIKIFCSYRRIVSGKWIRDITRSA